MPSRASVSPTAANSTAGVVVNAAGAVLPNPSRTPGALNPTVTQADIGTTICVAGWTATIRPPSSVTTALKQQQLATGYAYRGDLNTADYEEDHLVSLELGGAPDSPQNLWPEPYNVTDGAHVKDQVENKLHTLVCSGALSLAAAQHAIATNWYLAYEQYVGVAAAPATSTRPASTHAAPTPPAPTPTAPTPTAIAPTPAPAQCYPLTNSGHCYEPGEYCRASDHGATGVAGDGETITCEDKNGWRWVPTG